MVGELILWGNDESSYFQLSTIWAQLWKNVKHLFKVFFNFTFFIKEVIESKSA